MTCQNQRKKVVGKPFSSHGSGLLYGVQVDVPIGNFRRCFWGDTFNNTLLGRKYDVINILIT